MASKEFSNTLKNLRIKAGYTQKQVYEHFHIPQSTFSSWEVGKSEPSGEMLIKLCEFYRCDMIKEFSNPENTLFTASEFKLIEKYRDLDDHGKDMVDTVLNKEFSRSKPDIIHESNGKLYVVEAMSPNPKKESNVKSNKSYLEPVAAHKRIDIEITDEMRKHDDDIMNDDDFWNK